MAEERIETIKDCDDCPYSIWNEVDDYVWCGELHRDVQFVGIPIDCPMIDSVLTYVWPIEK